MYNRFSPEEEEQPTVGPSSRRVSISSEQPAITDRGDLVTAEESTSYSPVGCLQSAANAVCRWIWHTGTGATIASSTIMSLNAVAIKYLGQPGHRVVIFEIVTVRGGGCLLLSLLVGAVGGMHLLKSQRKNWPVLTVRGISVSVSMALYLVAIINLKLADAITLFFCNPALTVLLAWAFLGEPLVPKALAGIACSLVGVVFVAQPPFIFGGHDLWTHGRVLGVSCGILAAFTSATAYVSIRKVSRTESALAIALWFHCSSFLMGAAFLVVGVPDSPTVPSLGDWAIMLAVAVTSFGGQLVLGRAYQIELAAKVAAINYVQVLYAFLFGLTLFGDSISLLSMFGSVLIAGGIVASSISRDKPAPPQPSSDKQALEMAESGAAPRPASSAASPQHQPSKADQHPTPAPLQPEAAQPAADKLPNGTSSLPNGSGLLPNGDSLGPSKGVQHAVTSLGFSQGAQDARGGTREGAAEQAADDGSEAEGSDSGPLLPVLQS